LNRTLVRILKIAGAALLLLLVVAAGGLLWAKSATATRLAQHFETHRAEFPIPFPLSEAEIQQLRAERQAALPPAGITEEAVDPLAGVDLAAVATERAIARGKHLADSRYACMECHGHDFAGGTMIDSPPIGKLFGPNLTGGAGSRVATFKASDWDRSVRHGVRPDGTPAVMPSIDFFAMSDRELSDLVSFIRSHPQVDRTMGPLSFGPLLNVLMATDKFRISAEVHPDHAAAHVVEAPPESDVLAFGGHLAQACTGCHNHEFTGGPIVGGPPEWAPAANLTPGPDGLAGWKFETFERVLRTGVKHDGQHVKLPMTLMLEPGKAMRDEEVKAMWAFFQSLPPKATGK
jgi:cytochrome c5